MNHKTDPTEQELAEYWADIIPNVHFLGYRFSVNAENIFHTKITPIIFAHLIQNFMEGEGYVWSLKKGNGYTADYELRENIKDAWKHHAIGNSDNKWLTNALAAWRAKEGK
ncbi:hypothetical protein IIC44_02830 [Patescibacteria group bacterium]|nr:hypothetical protein [Patescibacteria group bacterium]